MTQSQAPGIPRSEKVSISLIGPLWLWLALVLLVGTGVRLYRIWLFPFIGQGDPSSYVQLAGGLLEGKGLSESLQPPLYPILIAFFSLITRNIEVAALAAAFLPGMALIILVFFLCRLLFDELGALFAAAICAVSSPLIQLSTSALSESLFFAFILGGLIAGLYLRKKSSHVLAAITGLIWGLAYLTRPEGLVIGLGWFAVTIFLSRKSAAEKIVPRIWLTAVAVWLFVLFGNMAYIRFTTGAWTFSPKGTVNFIQGELESKYSTQPFGEAMARRSVFVTNANFDLMQYLRDNWPETIERYWHNLNTEREMVLSNLGYLLVALTAVYFFSKSFGIQDWHDNLYLATPLIWLAALPIFHLDPRYVTSSFPVFYICAGLGCVRILKWIEQSMQLSEKQVRVVAFSLLALAVFAGLYYDRNDLERIPFGYEHKELASWMNQNIAALKGQTIVATNYLVPFYTQSSWKQLPIDMNQSDLKAFALENNARYLVADATHLEMDSPDKPELLDLLNAATAHTGFRMIHQIPGAYPIVLYEIAP